MYADYNTLRNANPSQAVLRRPQSSRNLHVPAGMAQSTPGPSLRLDSAVPGLQLLLEQDARRRVPPKWIDTVVETLLAIFHRYPDRRRALYHLLRHVLPAVHLDADERMPRLSGNQTFIDGNRCKTPEELAALVTVPQLAEGETVARGCA